MGAFRGFYGLLGVLSGEFFVLGEFFMSGGVDRGVSIGGQLGVFVQLHDRCLLYKIDESLRNDN